MFAGTWRISEWWCHAGSRTRYRMLNLVLWWTDEPWVSSLDERMNGWMDERMNGWTDERMNGWTDEWMNGWTLSGWTDERMNAWVDERMNGWTLSGWTDERMNVEWMNGWTDEPKRMNGWTEENLRNSFGWTDERMNDLRNSFGWTDERMNDLRTHLDERMNLTVPVPVRSNYDLCVWLFETTMTSLYDCSKQLWPLCMTVPNNFMSILVNYLAVAGKKINKIKNKKINKKSKTQRSSLSNLQKSSNFFIFSCFLAVFKAFGSPGAH